MGTIKLNFSKPQSFPFKLGNISAVWTRFTTWVGSRRKSVQPVQPVVDAATTSLGWVKTGSNSRLKSSTWWLRIAAFIIVALLVVAVVVGVSKIGLKLVKSSPLSSLMGKAAVSKALPDPIVVNTTDDSTPTTPCAGVDGDCSLRAAIGVANLNPDSTITLPASETSYVLSSVLPVINAGVTINGGGANTTTIDGARLGDVLSIDGQGSVINVAVNGVTITDGLGSGIKVVSAALVLNESTVSANTNATGAGGLTIDTTSTATVRASTISGNDGTFGAISNQGTLNLVDSTVSGNTGTETGGIMNDGTAQSFSSTIAFNVTSAGTSLKAGGIFNQGTLTLSNTILSGNTDTSVDPAVAFDCSGDIASGGYNLVSDVDAPCNFVTATGDKTGVDPDLGSLGLNGGTTETLPITSGSPAVNAANPSGCVDNNGSTLTTDQRGAVRERGGRCDIGAYEFTGKNPSPTPKPHKNSSGKSHKKSKEPAEPVNPETYVIQRGEFPACIANRYDIDTAALLKASGIGEWSILQPGFKLTLPKDAGPYKFTRALLPHPASYTVARGQDLFGIACLFGDVKPEDIAAANNLPNPFFENTTFTRSGKVIQIP